MRVCNTSKDEWREKKQNKKTEKKTHQILVHQHEARQVIKIHTQTLSKWAVVLHVDDTSVKVVSVLVDLASVDDGVEELLEVDAAASVGARVPESHQRGLQVLDQEGC